MRRALDHTRSQTMRFTVAGFVLERDEHDATRTLRALARRDDAGHTDHAPMRQVAQIG